MEEENFPVHIAIIMDGNRRWARKKMLPVKLGHKQGAETLKKIVRYANKIGLKYISVYAFSTENWKRSEEEVNDLMFLLESYLDDFAKEADTENIVIKVIGRREELSERLLDKIDKTVERTKDNTGTVFSIALNYGGRDEIVHSVKEISKKVLDGTVKVEEIDEKMISENLYTNYMPDPDLLIRTSGEIRTSNFMPWQIVYSEYLFVEKLWPDFEESDLDDAIKEYQKRNRKFGAK